MQELLHLLRDLDLQHQAHLRSHAGLRNLILQMLAHEPAYQALEKKVLRAKAANAAHRGGNKLIIDNENKTTGAFATASKELAGTAGAGKPATVKLAHQAVQKQQREMLKAAAKAVEIAKKWGQPKS